MSAAAPWASLLQSPLFWTVDSGAGLALATGGGKTEVTRALAQELFGSAEMMTRIDMSEDGEQHSVARLIGAPPG